MPNSRPLALLIDDNREIRSYVRMSLEREVYEVMDATNGIDALRFLERRNADVILLDIMLDQESGLSLIPKIRKFTEAPIIILSGKDNLMDMVIGLEAGADDYINKPFRIQEVIARIKSHVRRYRRTPRKKIVHGRFRQGTQIKFSGYLLDRNRMQVYSAAGVSAALTVREFRLLDAMVSSAGQVLSREQLLDGSRDSDLNVSDRAIDIQITRIRKKLEHIAPGQNLIQAVRGAGYLIDLEPELVL